jgi:selenide,water dikinase
LGSEWTLGFTVTGLCDEDPVTLAGARPGDSVFVTKPIGTGVIMAAEMAKAAPGAVVLSALGSMMIPQAKASAALVAANVHAMTDVTGFGLFGHLRNICMASECGALIWRDHVPLLPGALALSGAGHRSSLFAENRAQWHGTEADPLTDLLFDPQTAGGLLAAVPGDPAEVMERLKSAGVEVWLIGTMTDRVGQIDIS